MTPASFSDWAAAVSIALSVCSAVTIPFVLWVDADYLLVADWQPVRDRVLVEVTNARHTVRDIQRRLAVTAAALLLLLSAPTAEVSR
ncbi:hypothetical protein [Streptomyces sp. NPDC008240]|uniref:hypothetical protein n=1 Tax=Streptomyces sp. NPDC008240 TaxID=3364822 RepID=UPI0036EC5E78